MPASGTCSSPLILQMLSVLCSCFLVLICYEQVSGGFVAGGKKKQTQKQVMKFGFALVVQSLLLRCNIRFF